MKKFYTAILAFSLLLSCSWGEIKSFADLPSTEYYPKNIPSEEPLPENHPPICKLYSTPIDVDFAKKKNAIKKYLGDYGNSKVKTYSGDERLFSASKTLSCEDGTKFSFTIFLEVADDKLSIVLTDIGFDKNRQERLSEIELYLDDVSVDISSDFAERFN